MPKYLFTFEKSEAVRWLGHLDILRTFERAVRRAGLPIAFSNGFNPRERITFASALSTGITGKLEPAILEMTIQVSPESILSELNSALPPGLIIHSCEEIPEAGSRDLLNSYNRAEYEILCDCPADTSADSICSAINELLACSNLPIVREREGRAKSLDIRPFLFELSLINILTEINRLTLSMIVALGENGTIKPNEVVQILAEKLPGLATRRAHRARLISNFDQQPD